RRGRAHLVEEPGGDVLILGEVRVQPLDGEQLPRPVRTCRPAEINAGGGPRRDLGKELERERSRRGLVEPRHARGSLACDRTHRKEPQPRARTAAIAAATPEGVALRCTSRWSSLVLSARTPSTGAQMRSARTT